MLDLGVISKVDYPTHMVCQQGGGTQEDRRGTYMCHLKPLNTNVLCEVHPLPAVARQWLN